MKLPFHYLLSDRGRSRHGPQNGHVHVCSTDASEAGYIVGMSSYLMNCIRNAM